MTVPIVFGCLSALFALLLFYFLDLTLFWLFQNRAFSRRYDDPQYRLYLEEKQKKTKRNKKKNYYLYLLIKTLILENESKKAASLLPFLKEDRLLGIEKRSIQI